MTWQEWLKILFCGRSKEWPIRLSHALMCQRWTRDIGLVMQKACFGRLPSGKYIKYHVYTRHLSREELCVFLPEGALQQIDACTRMAAESLTSRMLSCTIDEIYDLHVGITMAISLDFEGTTPDGQTVSIHVKDEPIIAALAVDPIWDWKVVKLMRVHSG